MNEIDKKLFEYLGIKYMTHSGDKNFQRVHWDTWILPTLEKRGFDDVWTSCIVLRELSNIDDRITLSTVPSLRNFHKWMNEKFWNLWYQHNIAIIVQKQSLSWELLDIVIPYESSVQLMQQSDTTKEAIIKLIEEYGN